MVKKLLEQFTRERLESLINDEDCRVTVAEQEALAEIALALMDANHIGVIYIDPEDGEPTVGWIEKPWDMPPGTKLYTLPQ